MAMRNPGSARSLLSQATLLTLRHALIFVLAIAALAAAALLMLALAGHCFQSPMTVCVSPEIYAWLGGQPVDAQYVVVDHALDFARYAIGMTALLIFFATIGSVMEGAVVARSSWCRLRLFGRIVVHRLVLATVSIAYWIVSNVVLIPAFGDDFSFASAGSHLCLIACLTILLSFLDARVAFYLPAAAYSATPEGFWRCWAATRIVMRPLFWIYLPMNAIIVLINMYFWFWGPQASVTQALAGTLASWTQSHALITSYIMSHSIGMILTVAIGLLMSGPIAAAAFRDVRERESLIFD
jgi:hypothetical protein